MLSPSDRPLGSFGSLQEVREAAERDYILNKLEEASGNVSRTAELLGLERSNLYRRMKTLGRTQRIGVPMGARFMPKRP